MSDKKNQKCNNCNISKPLTVDYFHAAINNKSGFTYTCKFCRCKLAIERRIERCEASGTKYMPRHIYVDDFSDPLAEIPATQAEKIRKLKASLPFLFDKNGKPMTRFDKELKFYEPK